VSRARHTPSKLPRSSKPQRKPKPPQKVKPQQAALRPAQDEGLLEVDDIQGNILGAFNKDHQLLVALAIHDVAAAKSWLSRVAPFISSVAEVAQFNRLFRARRRRLGTTLWA
jgi:hypothetical protein